MEDDGPIVLDKRFIRCAELFKQYYDEQGYFSCGIQEVEELPDEGTQGIIYYNTEDDKYYIYADNFAPLVPQDLPVETETEEYGGILPLANSYTIEPNKYYILGEVDNMNSNVAMILAFINSGDGDVAKQYCGRFTSLVDDLVISIVTTPGQQSIHFSDNQPQIKTGHTYEFNVLYDTCLLTDITFTNS